MQGLADFAESRLVVLAFMGTECPLAKRYAPRLQKLADQFAPSGVTVIVVDANTQDSLAELAAYAQRHELTIPVLKDVGNRLADLVGATRTPEVFLLDQLRRIRYQGRIDDQHRVGVVGNAPANQELRDAIEQLLAGRPVEVPRTEAVGCLIGRVPAVAAAGDNAPRVTYADHIAPLLARACVECHRPGEIGPFPLTDYEQASGWGEMLAEVVAQRRMPPWHADPAHGTFANDRSLTTAERELFQRWVAQGCPEGDSQAKGIVVDTFTGWQLPEAPHQIFAMGDEPFAVPAEVGIEGVPYQYFRTPTEFTEDRWVTVAEVQPGNRSVVHHIIVYAEPAGSRGRRDWIFLTAYVPGLRYDPLPPQTAKRVPAGSTLVFEQHYTPIGSPQTDISRIGFLYAAPEEVAYEAVTCEIGNVSFVIPPHASQHVVTAASQPLKQPMTLLSLSPHMHVRGKAFRYEVVSPNGERETLLDVPNYDFNWQTRYVLAEPRLLRAGEVIACRAVFDNSEQNLANPDPEATVRWGDQSWDEMMLGYFDLMLPIDEAPPGGRKWVRTGLDVVGTFDRCDQDEDGYLSSAEVVGHKIIEGNFSFIDGDQDGRLELAELLRAAKRIER